VFGTVTISNLNHTQFETLGEKEDVSRRHTQTPRQGTGGGARGGWCRAVTARARRPVQKKTPTENQTPKRPCRGRSTRRSRRCDLRRGRNAREATLEGRGVTLSVQLGLGELAGSSNAYVERRLAKHRPKPEDPKKGRRAGGS